MNPETLFKLLSDTTRLRIIALLAGCGELCVCEFTKALGESQPKVSRHLALMRQEGLVTSRRQGTWMHYRIGRKLPPWAARIVSCAHEELGHQDPFRQDAARRERAGRQSGGGACA